MSEEAPAIIGIAALAIDCTDPPRLAHWWSRLLGGAVEMHPQGYATLHTPEGLALDFLPVPEPKTGKNRLHLDVRSQKFATAVAQALALGATQADDIYAGARWQVSTHAKLNLHLFLGQASIGNACVRAWRQRM